MYFADLYRQLYMERMLKILKENYIIYTNLRNVSF